MAMYVTSIAMSVISHLACHLPYPHADVRNIILAWVGVMISNTESSDLRDFYADASFIIDDVGQPR